MLASITLPEPGDTQALIALMKKLGYLASDYVVPEGIALVAFLAWVLLMYLLLKKFFS